MNYRTTRISAVFTTLLLLLLISGCKRGANEQQTTTPAAGKSLAISPKLFATRFNRTVRDVLDDRGNADAARMAPLYAIDISSLPKDEDIPTFQVQVGPSQTAIIGSMAKDGDIRTVGVLLTSRTEDARNEYYLCAETASRILTDGDKKKLPDLIRRLTDNALNNPGQHMTNAVGDKLLSVEVIQQGLMFQIESQP